MQPDRFVEHYRAARASAILRTDLADAAGPAMDAAVRGGFTVVEFTMTTPGALELIGSFSRREGLVVGAGTVLSPDDAHAAVGAGAGLQKLFPAPGIGPSYVKAMLGPMPFLRIVPTSGVDASNARAFLDAGAWAVGFVAPLFAAGDLAGGRFARIEERARSLLAACG